MSEVCVNTTKDLYLQSGLYYCDCAIHVPAYSLHFTLSFLNMQLDCEWCMK